MRLFTRAVVSALVLGLSTSAWAGDLQKSIASATFEQPQSQPRPAGKIPASFLWPGAALFVAGMTMATYGFLHTSGGEFVSGEVSKESNTKLGGAGLAMAGAGGAILFLGHQRARSAPSIAVGPGRVAVAKKLSW